MSHIFTVIKKIHLYFEYKKKYVERTRIIKTDI